MKRILCFIFTFQLLLQQQGKNIDDQCRYRSGLLFLIKLLSLKLLSTYNTHLMLIFWYFFVEEIVYRSYEKQIRKGTIRLVHKHILRYHEMCIRDRIQTESNNFLYTSLNCRGLKDFRFW